MITPNPIRSASTIRKIASMAPFGGSVEMGSIGSDIGMFVPPDQRAGKPGSLRRGELPPHLRFIEIMPVIDEDRSAACGRRDISQPLMPFEPHESARPLCRARRL